MWKTSPININSSTCIPLNRAENVNYIVSSEKHLKKLNSIIGSYLGIELSIFVKLFEIYLVTPVFLR